ncbi:MAG: ribosome small subunit-dependent GTPase A [Clostridia bacterium]|nr:ribosome small subunit-dependent GTPase A [Clostridia bacterium]
MEHIVYPVISGEEFPGCIPALITAVHRELFEFVCEEGEGRAQVKRSLNLPEMPTIGDFVALRHEPTGLSIIHGILPRRTLFARADSWRGGRQLVAANVDIVFITTSLNMEFNLRRLERYMALVVESGAQPVFLLTKRDLATPMMLLEAEAAISALAPGAQIVCVSAHTGEGMDELEKLLTPGATAVLLGSSGVGKSSLVNALLSEERMRTNGIGENDKGHHTTVHRQMLQLRTGALLIDTPGMRELGMWDSLDGVATVFPEIDAAAARCRFRDCTHTHEPGCAVQAGIADGSLDPRRVRNYLAMHNEADVSAKHAAAAKRKQISANRKYINKNRR